MSPTARPMATEPTAKIVKELRDLAGLCDELSKVEVKSDDPRGRILEAIIWAMWSVKADILREAAHRLDPNSDPAPGAAR